MRSVLSLCRGIALAVITLALAGVGSVHPAPGSDAPQIEAFVLAGGSLADLCTDADGDGMPDHGDCPACHTTTAATPPALSLRLRDADLAFAAKVVAPRESRAIRPALDPAHGLRAPPVA